MCKKELQDSVIKTNKHIEKWEDLTSFPNPFLFITKRKPIEVHELRVLASPWIKLILIVISALFE